MTIKEALKECGWDDILIEHFTNDSFEAVDENIQYYEKPCFVDNSTLFVTSNEKKDRTDFVFYSK